MKARPNALSINADPSTAGLLTAPTLSGSRPDTTRQIVGLDGLLRNIERNDVTTCDVDHVDGRPGASLIYV